MIELMPLQAFGEQIFTNTTVFLSVVILFAGIIGLLTGCLSVAVLSSFMVLAHIQQTTGNSWLQAIYFVLIIGAVIALGAMLYEEFFSTGEQDI